MRIITTMIVLCLAITPLKAQEKSGVITDFVSAKNLPCYVIITSQNTKALGGIGMYIDTKKSKYKNALEQLEQALQHRKKLKIRNQTDLLNAMDDLGYDFIDAYNASQVQYAMDKDVTDDITNALFEGGSGSFKVNMIFKKQVLSF